MFSSCQSLIWAFAHLMAPVMASGSAYAVPPGVSSPGPTVSATPGVPPLPPAQFDPTLNVEGVGVEARRVESRLSVPVSINGSGPYQFLVDSGADTSAVGLGIARILKLPLGTPVMLNGMTSRSMVDRFRINSLKLGPTTVHHLHLPALREVDMGADGLIGIDALSQQRLMMDFDKRIIKVEDARIKVRALPGEIVIIGRRKRGQLILAQVRASNQRLDAIIDTGSELTVGNFALRDKLLPRMREEVSMLELVGVTGERVPVQLVIIDELQLGPILLRDVPIAFADLPPFKLFGLADEPALLLGTDILEKFRRVSLDFRSRKVRFQLRRCTTEGVVFRTAPKNASRISAVGVANDCIR